MNSTEAPLTLDFARKLIAHNSWENQRVCDLAITPLSDEQFTQEVGYSWGSIQRVCIQILETERTCLQRISEDTFQRDIPAANLADRETIGAHFRLLHETWARFTDVLDHELFFAWREYEDEGRKIELEVWKLIFDIIYSGTAHRAAILRMVAKVHQPVEFDLSLMQYLTGVFRP